MSTTLGSKKELIKVQKEGSFLCPDDSHPLFTILVTKNRPGICYYCSKMFVYDNEEENQ